MLAGQIVSFDTETTGLNTHQGGRIFAYTAANQKGQTLYVEEDHFKRDRSWSGNYNDLPRVDRSHGKVRQSVRTWLKDPRVSFVFHNAKFDLKMLRAFGIEPAGEVHDTMILAHVLGAQGAAGASYNENVLRRLSLKSLSEKYLENVVKDDGPKLWLKANTRAFVEQRGRQPNYSDVPRNIMEPYAKLDARLTIALFDVFWPHVQKDPQLLKVYQTEMRLLRHIVDMELRGVRLDTKFMDERVAEFNVLEKNSKTKLISMSPTLKMSYTKNYTKNKVKLKRRLIETIKPTEINFNSDDQIRQILYRHFKFPIHGWTQLDPGKDPESVPAAERGQPSVDERCLSRIDHPFPAELVRYRQYLKTRDVYYVGYRRHMDGDILHPNYNQAATQTGRFSSSDPNLQNIPMEEQVRERAGADVIYKGVKRAFIPRDGFTNYHYDYSSIELRMFAHGVNDPQITDAVVNYDLHDWTTELLFGKRETMTAQEFEYKRVLAKIVNFGILYGMGTNTFMWKMKKTREEVQELLGLYFGRLPKVKQFQHDVIERVRENGYLRNIFGRRYVIDPHYAYKGVNYYCQGSAADVLKRAMVRVGDFLKDKQSNMLMTIHDEIVIEVHKSEEKVLPWDVKRIMANHPEVRLPIKVSMERANGNWENLEKVRVRKIV